MAALHYGKLYRGFMQEAEGFCTTGFTNKVSFSCIRQETAKRPKAQWASLKTAVIRQKNPPQALREGAQRWW